MDRIEKDFQIIFDTAMGEVRPQPPFEWVEDIFSSGTQFAQAYEDFAMARNNLCERFSLEEEDEDLELFMNGLLKMEEDLGKRMFFYGVKYTQMIAK